MENIRVEIKNVDIENVYPNPWNPNRQSTRTEEATTESIGQYGMIDPITVRPHPEHDGKYQVIDGEHRQRACTNLGYKKIPVNILRNVTDEQAKKLTIIANETRGYADNISLSELLTDLSSSMSVEDLLIGLPYYKKELDDLINLGSVEWDRFGIETNRADDVVTDPDVTIDEESSEKFEVELRNLINRFPNSKVTRV
jgi:hypothetical protein